MSALGIYQSDFGTTSHYAMPTRHTTIALAIVGLGLLAIAVAGRPEPTFEAPAPHKSSADLAPRHPSFSVIGLSSRPRPIDPIADFMRHGPMPDARMPKGWVPDTMVSPDICRLPVTKPNWRTAPDMTPSAFLAAHPTVSSRRGGKGRAAERKTRHLAAGRAALFLGIRSIGFAVDGDAGKAARAKGTSAFDNLPPFVIAELDATAVATSAVQGLGNPIVNAENRRAAPIGTAASALQFDDRPGQLSAAAQAGLWNGTPATAMGVGYTLPNRVRLDAAGVTNVNAWANIGKTLQVSAVASLPLD